jgi:hypothetical protein
MVFIFERGVQRKCTTNGPGRNGQQVNFFATASLSAESSTDSPRWEMKPIAAHFEDGKCRDTGCFAVSQKIYKKHSVSS